MIAVNCGTPTPATIRVVQIEPGPIPTLIASAPAPTSALAASAVATLPATTWTEFDSLDPLDRLRDLEIVAVRGVDDDQSQPASISASDRAKPLSPTVVAARRAAALRLLGRVGELTAFSMSLTVIRPMQWCSSSTTSNFSIRRWWRIRCASSWLVPSGDRREILAGHQLATGWRILGEAHVAVGQDAASLPDPRRSGCRDAVGAHQLKRVGRASGRASW